MVIKPGQIYQLGNHKLMCGDSTNRDHVNKLMNGRKANLLVADPPYGAKKERFGVKNDNLNQSDLVNFNKGWVKASFDLLAENGSWYCWGYDTSLLNMYSEVLKPMIDRDEIALRNLIVWDKGKAPGQLSPKNYSYANATEKCLFFVKSVALFNNNSDHYYKPFDKIRMYLVNEAEKAGLTPSLCKQITKTSYMYKHWFTKSQWSLITQTHYEELQKYFKKYGYFKKDYQDLKKDYQDLKYPYFNNVHDNFNNVWHFRPADRKEREKAGFFPTIKPLKVCERIIKSSSRENDIVVDLFGGSGSTLIACERLNRLCYLMELDRKNCELIIKRWEAETGKKAKLIS